MEGCYSSGAGGEDCITWNCRIVSTCFLNVSSDKVSMNLENVAFGSNSPSSEICPSPFRDF